MMNCHDDLVGVAKFLTNFPRLKSIDHYPKSRIIEGLRRVETLNSLTNFRILLPAFEQLENLNSLSLRIEDNEEEDGFAERFLRTKTEKDKIKIAKRLSNVKRLSVECSPACGTNWIDFIAKYLTGLEYLRLVNPHVAWTENAENLYCNELLKCKE